ncbi:TPA: hypothetical protein N0F65_009258 [Lagenidium giganteum]|uniref:DNA replication complex GINS protein SLD5 n=1 Tax=Lagenidium giganteum TaxID=4803 RepID=A0AAV2YMV3_9STRA|nr:TPA: hypothetical protein N0F65_009258 [Lagenidium giganteum]
MECSNYWRANGEGIAMDSHVATFNRENLNEDVDRLKVLWVNEMNAPEVLPFDEEIVTEMLEQLDNQQNYVDSVGEDRATLTDERVFTSKLYQMEIDRLRFMLTSYLRTRLRKVLLGLAPSEPLIERFAMHILSDPVMTQRLSQKEIRFAKQYVETGCRQMCNEPTNASVLCRTRYAMLFENHVNDLALSRFPEEHRAVNVEGMIVEPDLDCFVFCESKADLGQIQCDDRGAEYITMREQDRHVVRYRSVKPHVEDGQVALI